MKFLRMFSELGMGRVLLMSLLVTAGYYFVYYDSGESIEQERITLEGQLAQQEARRLEITKTMKKEEDMKANTLLLKRHVESVKGRIPTVLTDAQMQAFINETAKAAGVNITALAADSANAKLSEGPPVEIPIENVTPEQLISEVKFYITMNSTYEAFLNFLLALAKEDRVIKIRNFGIGLLSENLEEDKILFKGEIIGFKQANMKIKSKVK